MARHVIQIDFTFAEPMQLNTDYADDCIECANEFISSLARTGSVISDGVSFWSRPDLYSWIGYSLRSDILATNFLTAWNISCLAQLNELDCKVSSQKLEKHGVDITNPDTTPKYLVIYSSTADSPITDSDGNPFDLFTIDLDETQREELSEWNSIYSALFSLWLGLPKMEAAAYKHLANYRSEINSKGLRIRKTVELASGIPTYYFLLRSPGYSKNETWRNCPKCGGDWCSHTKDSSDHWNFEFRCDVCRLVASQGDDYENKSQPDDSDRGYSYVMRGADMTPEQILEMEARLIKNPDDLQARLSLVGYYHHVPMAQRTTTKAFPHIMWLVENHPDAFTCRYIGLGKPYTAEQNNEFEKLWLEQIRLNPTDAKIVGNAGSRILATTEKLGWHYIMQAALLNPNEEYWARKIAHHFAYLALNGDLSERRHHGEIAIREAERFFRLQGSSGERFSVCHDVTPVAIQLGYLDEARKWNNWVLEHMSYSIFNQFGQLAWLLLAQIELSDGKQRKSKILLRKALHSMQDGVATSAPSSSTMVALLEKLLVAGHRGIVIEALEVCAEKASENRKDQLQGWLEQLKKGENPKLEFPKR